MRAPRARGDVGAPRARGDMSRRTSDGGTGGWRTATAAALTVTSYVLVRSGASEALDNRVAAVAHRPRQARTDRLVSAATELGSVYGLTGVAVALAVGGKRRTAGDVAGAGATAWTTAQAIKPFLARERPYQLGACERLVSEPAGTSWPSGHSAVIAAMATVLAGRTASPTARRLILAGVLGIGASRLYVGVHHFTDVIAGYGLGVLAARLWSAVRPVTPAELRRR